MIGGIPARPRRTFSYLKHFLHDSEECESCHPLRVRGGKHCLFAYQSLSVSQFSQSFFFGISGIKCVQDKIFGIFYVQIHENLQICTEFSEISLSKIKKR